MDELKNLNSEQLANLAIETEDKDVLRAIADIINVTYSGNSGLSSLKEKILGALDVEKTQDDELDKDDPVVQAMLKHNAKPKEEDENRGQKKKPILEHSRDVLARMDAMSPGLSVAEQRAIVRARAMRLHRVRVTNLDPNDSALPGAIKTVYNKFCGKVSKFIPFGEENELGYHIPEILLNALREETYNMRKEVKSNGQSFGVKTYKTVPTRKFSIEMLDALTPVEIEALAKDQKARGAIDAHE